MTQELAKDPDDDDDDDEYYTEDEDDREEYPEMISRMAARSMVGVWPRGSILS